MKKLLLLAIPLSLLTCKPHAADKLAQTKLDSLSGALGLSYQSLLQVDTVRTTKALVLLKQYKSFVKQALMDTLTKTEADALTRFVNEGEVLENFMFNRIQLLTRVRLVVQQTGRLSSDLAAGKVHAEDIQSSIDNEEQEITKLIQVIDKEIKQGQSAILEMRHALPEVEQLIKNRNNNQLPTVITDTLAF